MENFSMVDFNYFDVAIASIVLLLGIKGFMHGFIKELFGLLGLVGGVYFASRLAGAAATFIDKNFLHLENTALLKLLGFLAILAIVWLSATILGSLFSKLSNPNQLSIISRFFGFIAGAGKYFIIFALIVTALSNVTLVKDNLEKHVKESILYPHLKKTGSYLINIDAQDLTLKNIQTSQMGEESVKQKETNTSDVLTEKSSKMTMSVKSPIEQNQSTLSQ